MKNSRRGFVIPLVLAIIALMLIGGGMYMYEHTKQANNNAMSVPTDWKTYKSKEFGLSVSVPNNWKEIVPIDGSLTDINESTFEGYAVISSPDEKETMVFMNGPLDIGNHHKCTEKLSEINNQKVNEISCSDLSGNTIPSSYNYEFIGKNLVLVLNSKTAITDEIVSLIKFD